MTRAMRIRACARYILNICGTLLNEWIFDVFCLNKPVLVSLQALYFFISVRWCANIFQGMLIATLMCISWMRSPWMWAVGLFPHEPVCRFIFVSLKKWFYYRQFGQFVLGYFCVSCTFWLLIVLVRLSIPKQVIDWKRLVSRVTFNMLMGSLCPTRLIVVSFLLFIFIQMVEKQEQQKKQNKI